MYVEIVVLDLEDIVALTVSKMNYFALYKSRLKILAVSFQSQHIENV